MSLLTVQNAKTSKGEELGYLTGILYLAPFTEAFNHGITARKVKAIKSIDTSRKLNQSCWDLFTQELVAA